MKHIVSLSGGVGSFIAADIVCKSQPKEDVILLFADVLQEDLDTYRFNKDISKYLGIPITTICYGKTPWEVMADEKYATNTRVDPCSRVLKREFIDTWIESNFRYDECISYVGIDASEVHRIENLAPRKLPYIYEAPIVNAGLFVSRKDKIRYCETRGFRAPRLYYLGFEHNNCGGACPKAGLKQWKVLWDEMPERYLFHEEQQRELLKNCPKARPFLRKTENGEERYLWLWEYREFYLEGPGQLSVLDLLDWGGCGCAMEAA